MPRTSMLEALLSQATPRPNASGGLTLPTPGTSLAAGASHLVEASSTEEALSRVHAQLGADARIVDARRVRRGGLGGFFAKEVVQLHARAGGAAVTSSTTRATDGATDRVPDRSRSAPSAAPSTPLPPSASATPSTRVPPRSAPSTPGAAVARPPVIERDARPAGGSPVDRLLADLDDAPDDLDFASYLRGHLAPETAAPTSDVTGGDSGGEAPSAGGPAPATAREMSPTPAGPAVDVRTRQAPWLTHDGPDVAVHTRRLDPGGHVAPSTAPAAWPSEVDQDGWSRDALVRLGLPLELVRVVEQEAPTDDLSWTTALTEALRTSCRPLPTGPCVLVGPRAHHLGTTDELDDVEVARSRAWFAAVRPGRWVHLVVGGEGWRDALDEDPLAVSWTRPEDLPDAVRCAVEQGLVLGHGPGRDGAARRARPFEVALAIRDQVVQP